ncbi:DegV family protein [Fructobacillus cardui]|jgi:DegV family protein with EDD domain|uniref:DegV family protein n=1 Tax=Fructobacillus cardui TaxID=2893170 RepID=A0ABN9YW00_9LACO|nr:DegV family protein [uncultured Fructobacillus sp.]CAK1221574.1 Fatty acid-binding protein DegV (function unknown) (DegV) [Fructobacillus cardui]CAK1249609.1 Fatty acid-binding protein DegV (function unknown) (DegV) [Fructobacillus cardui]CAK1250670.1 Fatty acid-binding protein DegV (function unknown) (DegV) [Fructobacillus cardui]
MTKKTAVIVDSSAALPAEIRRSYGIEEVSIPILFGQETYMGGQDLTSLADLVELMTKKDVLPTTSQPSPAEWEQALNQAVQAGYTEAIIITLSSGISGALQTAKLVADGFDGLEEILVVDSKLTNMGQASQALLAAKLAEKGCTLVEIDQALAAFREDLGVRLVVNDISHLKRTGRLSRGQALIGGLLNIKPILSFDIVGDGKIGAVGKARKMSGAKEQIQEAFEDYLRAADFPVRAYIIDGNNAKLGDKWLKDFQAKYPTVAFERASMDPVIGVHTGDGAMAVIWSHDWQDMAKED